MPLSWDEIQQNAVAFAKRWEKAHNEEAQAQSFETQLLQVFGVDDPERVGDFEYKVRLSETHNGYIDYLWKGRIAIEFKSKGKDLDLAYRQLQGYLQCLPEEEIPDLQMVCNFENFVLYRRSTKECWRFKLKDLRKHIKRFSDIAGYETQRIAEDQVEVNVKAAEKMARLHDALKEHGYEGHDLEVYLVRLLFCLFADDTGIFPRDSFVNYIEASCEDGSDLSDRIARLFEVLNMSEETRHRRTLLSDELKQFRYINGGLFQSLLPSAEFNAKMRQTLLDCGHFDWNKISPAIFGAMFQGVMDKTQRRELGAHYTSEENILKLINPLFLDGLWAEFERVKTDPAQLERFHDRLARLKFLDPACGCGNFLIITYRELRRLELEILRMKVGTNQLMFDISGLLKVSVEQFYGIEYEDFPCQIAQVGMWLIDHQMNLRASDMFGTYYARLPLTQSATIVHGNALRLDWESIVPKQELSYILGNPPFVGHQWRSADQAEDMKLAFHDLEKHGKLDYVAAWYNKAADLMDGTFIRAAFVSTNSIVQGESVGILWQHMFDKHMQITFAHRTFIWSNEAKGKAAVHCVIVGFADDHLRIEDKRIYDGDQCVAANNINGYLLDAPNVFIQARGKPLTAGMPEMSKGSQPTDGGYLILSAEERKELLAEYPQAEEWVKQYISADDFINGKLRYCLWLKGVAPAKYRAVKPILRRLAQVSEMRRNSPTASVQRDADTPMLFTQIRQPATKYLVVPEVSSERRRYIPIGYLEPEVIASNKLYIIPDATLYLFGVLTSNVHMAWMRVVCGRLKSDYSYSPSVYNNFPWPTPSDMQKAAIEAAAQGVLDTRSLFEDCSLADLYDPNTMPPELNQAHKKLDKAVWAAYGFTPRTHPSEASVVAGLMEMWRVMVR